MIILTYFIFLFFVFYRLKSVVTFFILLQIMSLLGMLLIGLEYPIDTLFKVFNLVLTIVILTLIIVPWQKYNGIKEISFSNEKKLIKLTRFLIIVSILPFVTFIVTSIFVIVMVEDINAFKYAEGVSTDFYYSLPFNVKAIILSNYLYYFSYFLIPLHFYYLSKKNYKMAIWCFVFSLNIILYGLTYFSRSVYIHYFFIYISFLVLLYGTLENSIKRNIRRILFVTLILVALYFVNISVKRFTDNNLYEELIPAKSYLKDPILYSYFDYSSQWYCNSMSLLNSYNFETFYGQISFQTFLNTLGNFGLISYDYDAYILLRKRLFSDYWYLFNGFVSYSVYDYGYFFTLVFTLLYYFVVDRLKPKKQIVSLHSLFVIVLLIQIPLLAIFYSVVGGILMPFLFYIPIYIYLKVSFRSNL